MNEPTDMNSRIRTAAGYGPPETEAEEADETPVGHVDFDGGARTSAPLPASMDTAIRRAAGVIR